ncbi:MAG: valine--tRNA ligase, partial [Chitinophagaceae bacterium]
PTNVLVTGQDIIFFWVARMIMAGMEYKQQRPFEHVYFTGMVRDKQGRKMSKSLGNSPDLLDLIDRFGADAVRFGILISSPAGNDLLFDDSSCEQGRNFNNKLWNALKLVKLWEGRQSDGAPRAGTQLPFAVEWFEQRLNSVKAQVEELYKGFRLSEALKTIYSLIWDDFCSWYLEWAKPGFEQPIDKAVYEKTVAFFSELMQLLHPFMPFISEEIYHQLAERSDDLCVKQYTPALAVDSNIIEQGSLLQEAITAIRDARVKNNLKPKDPVELAIQSEKSAQFEAISAILGKQVNAQVGFTSEAVPNSIALVIGTNKFYISSEQAVDTSVQKEQLLKDLEYQQGFLASVQKKLSNERFVQNAKPEVVEVERKKASDAQEKIETIQKSLALLG